MKKILFVSLLAMVWSVHAGTLPAKRPVMGPCVEMMLPGGARGMYCVPEQGWNGDVIVFAHGYTAATEPLDYQNLTFGEVYLPELVQQLGYAFATTTYRRNGLAIVEGVEDVRELVQAFRAATGKRAKRFIMTGASEGGIVTVLALDIGALIGGLIITEAIFNYPGMGKYFILASTNGDFPQMMPYLVIIITSVLLFNLFADVTYAFLDPRIRLD